MSFREQSVSPGTALPVCRATFCRFSTITLALTQNKPFNIEHSAFGDGSIPADWLNEIAWAFPLYMLSTETLEVLRIHAGRLAKLSTEACEKFENAAEALLKKSPNLAEEIERARVGMSGLLEASKIANQQSGPGESRSLRDALWEALECEAIALEPVRKGLDKEVSAFLKPLEPSTTVRFEQSQTLLEEALLEAPSERAHLIREARKFLRDSSNLESVPLDPILCAQIGWIAWQTSNAVTESLEWFHEELSDIEGVKGYGIAMAARLNAYFLACTEKYKQAYGWSKIAADLWPCTGTYHERARHAVSGATGDVAKREVAAFIKKSPIAPYLAFADPLISGLGPELLEICIERQVHCRQKAQVAVGEWELGANTVRELLRLLPNINIPNELLEGAEIAKSGLQDADFLIASQTLLRASDGKASLTAATHQGIQKEKRRRGESLIQAKQTVEAIMQERDDMLKSANVAQEDDLAAVRAALVEAEDNTKAQRGCGMGMGGGCAIMFVYMIVTFVFSSKAASMGPTTPFGMACIAIAMMPLAASVVYYVGCMSRRMMLESKLATQLTAAKRAFDQTQFDANVKFRDKLEAAKARVTQEEQALQTAEAVAKQFGG